MKFLTVAEDISRTQSSLESPLDRVVYNAQLRTSDGTYHHWGLAREYGHDVVNRQLAEAHLRCVLDAIRSSMFATWGEVCSSAQRHQLTCGEYIDRLLAAKSMLAAPGSSEPTLKHFDWLLRSLLAIARAQAAKRAAAA